MDVGTRERILIIRLIEKVRANPGYAERLGITVVETNEFGKKGT